MPRSLRALLSGILLALVVGCGSSGPDETEVLISLTDQVIVPTYQMASDDAQVLSAALEDVCSAPSEGSLQAARQAWRDARVSWMRSQAMGFGPVMDRRSAALVDWPTISHERIDATLVRNPDITDDEVRNVLASTQRGFGAVEYVLFDHETLSRLSEPQSPQCAYLTSLGRVIAAETAAIVEEWTVSRSGGAPYQDFFTGRSSSSLLTGAAVGEAVRTQVFLMRTISDLRLAAALGLRQGGPDLSAIPGGAADNALADLRAELQGMWDMYVGREDSGGFGISALVMPLSDAADERMRSSFEEALAAVEAIDGSLHAAVLERPEQVRSFYDRLIELRRNFNTEVVSLLGVSVGFSDTDGDSMR